jgi:hypothetical protein
MIDPTGFNANELALLRATRMLVISYFGTEEETAAANKEFVAALSRFPERQRHDMLEAATGWMEEEITETGRPSVIRQALLRQSR